MRFVHQFSQLSRLLVVSPVFQNRSEAINPSVFADRMTRRRQYRILHRWIDRGDRVGNSFIIIEKLLTRDTFRNLRGILSFKLFARDVGKISVPTLVINYQMSRINLF